MIWLWVYIGIVLIFFPLGIGALLYENKEDCIITLKDLIAFFVISIVWPLFLVFVAYQWWETEAENYEIDFKLIWNTVTGKTRKERIEKEEQDYRERVGF